jgi:hypothetical protein
MSTIGGGMGNRPMVGQKNESKNPSTAAGTYVQGFGAMNGGYGGGLKSGGGLNGKYQNESFDLDIMMPPDIASIDSDISKFLESLIAFE